jgi:transcription initiation factor TFIIH subunit 1
MHYKTTTQPPAAPPPSPSPPAAAAGQQQAPGKPFLRILSAAEPLGLAFRSDDDRNEVLELLKQLTPSPAAAPGAPAPGVPTPPQRQQLFAADPDLETLYGQLVVSGILPEADFWRTRQGALGRLAAGARGRGGGGGAAGAAAQRPGLSSVLHDVERLHDGQTERVNIHLTPADITRIFTERPEVHRAFLAHVPHALEEKAFWERYFKLEYKKAAKRCAC